MQPTHSGDRGLVSAGDERGRGARGTLGSARIVCDELLVGDVVLTVVATGGATTHDGSALIVRGGVGGDVPGLRARTDLVAARVAADLASFVLTFGLASVRQLVVGAAHRPTLVNNSLLLPLQVVAVRRRAGCARGALGRRRRRCALTGCTRRDSREAARAVGLKTAVQTVTDDHSVRVRKDGVDAVDTGCSDLDGHSTAAVRHHVE